MRFVVTVGMLLYLISTHIWAWGSAHINRTRQGLPLLSSKANRELGFVHLPAHWKEGHEEEDGVREAGHTVLESKTLNEQEAKKTTCLCTCTCNLPETSTFIWRHCDFKPVGGCASEKRETQDTSKDWERKMPESKQAVHRTGSYLSNSAYRKIKRVLSFRRREYFKLFTETCWEILVQCCSISNGAHNL